MQIHWKESRRGNQEKKNSYQMSRRIFVEENEALAQVAKCQERRQLGNEQDGVNSDMLLRCSGVVVRDEVVRDEVVRDEVVCC